MWTVSIVFDHTRRQLTLVASPEAAGRDGVVGLVLGHGGGHVHGESEGRVTVDHTLGHYQCAVILQILLFQRRKS